MKRLQIYNIPENMKIDDNGCRTITPPSPQKVSFTDKANEYFAGRKGIAERVNEFAAQFEARVSG